MGTLISIVHRRVNRIEYIKAIYSTYKIVHHCINLLESKHV